MRVLTWSYQRFCCNIPLTSLQEMLRKASILVPPVYYLCWLDAKVMIVSFLVFSIRLFLKVCLFFFSFFHWWQNKTDMLIRLLISHPTYLCATFLPSLNADLSLTKCRPFACERPCHFKQWPHFIFLVRLRSCQNCAVWPLAWMQPFL